MRSCGAGVTARLRSDSSINGKRRSCAWEEDLMEASASEIEKSTDVAMAEDICTLLEQTILKYFPANEADRPRQASVPLVPPREE
jgi:hypothetical protein